VNPDPGYGTDPIRIQGFDDQKLKEKNTAIGEAFSPQKRTFSTSKN
jgi:hypothetical protein